MNVPTFLPKILLTLALGAGLVTSSMSEPAAPAARLVPAAVTGPQHETMLLVSLDDGTVIKQMISVDADVCFKQNSSSSTMCLTQGSPILDEITNTIIGFEMLEDHIELVAKTE